MISGMSETPETPTRPTTVATEPATVVEKPYWLYRCAAWVAIIAGIVFIVTTIFFAGFKIAHFGHHGHHHHGGWHGQHALDQGGPRHHGEGAAFHGGFGGPGPSHIPESVGPQLAPAQP
jgi:hypothetical protein